jgi:hypothetical protein
MLRTLVAIWGEDRVRRELDALGPVADEPPAVRPSPDRVADVASRLRAKGRSVDYVPEPASGTKPLRRRRALDTKLGGSIYFVQAGGGDAPIKIGFSTDVAQRLADLQVANPRELRLLLVVSGTEDIEAAFHHRFRKHHIRGEWFHPASLVLGAIKSGGLLPPEGVE